MMECTGAIHWLVISVLTLLVTSGIALFMAWSMLAYTIRFRRVPQQARQQPPARNTPR